MPAFGFGKKRAGLTKIPPAAGAGPHAAGEVFVWGFSGPAFFCPCSFRTAPPHPIHPPSYVVGARKRCSHGALCRQANERSQSRRNARGLRPHDQAGGTRPAAPARAARGPGRPKTSRHAQNIRTTDIQIKDAGPIAFDHVTITINPDATLPRPKLIEQARAVLLAKIRPGAQPVFPPVTGCSRNAPPRACRARARPAT